MNRSDDLNSARRTRGRPPESSPPDKTARSRLARTLREIREHGPENLRDFAAWSGYSASHISRVERNQAVPSPELVEKYEERFRTDGLLISLYESVLTEQRDERQIRRGADREIVSEAPIDPAGSTRPGDRSEFVEDVTLSDGERVEPNTTLLKVWRIRNVGTVPWRGRALQRDGALTGPSVIKSPLEAPVADTEPGEAVDIQTEITSPRLPGTTIAYWKMVDGEGRTCFPDRYADGLYVRLQVTGPH